MPNNGCIICVDNKTGKVTEVPIDCNRPRWESVYRGYPKDVSDNKAFEQVGYNLETAKIDRFLGDGSPQEIKASASAIRISVALLMVGMQRCLDDTVSKPNSRILPVKDIGRGLLQKGFFANVTTLKTWLLKEDVWRKAEVNG